MHLCTEKYYLCTKKKKTTRALETNICALRNILVAHCIYGPPYGSAMGSPVSVVEAEMVMQNIEKR